MFQYKPNETLLEADSLKSHYKLTLLETSSHHHLVFQQMNDDDGDLPTVSSVCHSTIQYVSFALDCICCCHRVMYK